MGAVGGIHIHQDRSRAGATQLHHHPFHAIGGPEPNAVPGADPARTQSERDASRQFAQFAPAIPFRLMTGDQGETIAPAFDGLIEHLPNRFLPQRLVWPTRVAEHLAAPPSLSGFSRAICLFLLVRIIHECPSWRRKRHIVYTHPAGSPHSKMSGWSQWAASRFGLTNFRPTIYGEAQALMLAHQAKQLSCSRFARRLLLAAIQSDLRSVRSLPEWRHSCLRSLADLLLFSSSSLSYTFSVPSRFWPSTSAELSFAWGGC